MKVLRVACALLTAACFIVISGAAVEPIQNEVGRKVEESQREERKADGAPASREQGAEHRIVDFSPKPHSVVIEKKEEKRKNRKGKGNGRKRDPCLKKFKDYCFHGTCRYIRPLRKPSCLCQHGYHGERCHGLILPVENPTQSYDNTTTLAVVAVVLSTLCLVIIAALLLLRYQRRGGYDVESSEKTKLGIAAGNLCSHSER